MDNIHNLYDNREFFRLIIDGVNYPITEPVGWDKVTIKGERDKDYYGFNFEFIDDETVTLLFVYGAGEMLLKGLYDRVGSDAEALFQFGWNVDGTPVVQYTGTVNFNTYSYDEEGVSVSIEKNFFEKKLRTRSETKVSLSAVKTYDGAEAIPIIPNSIKLHSKTIKKYGEGQGAPGAASIPVHFGVDNNGTFYIQADTQNITKEEVGTVYSMPLAFTAATPQSESRFHFSPEEAGLVTLRWAVDSQLIIDFHISGDPVTITIKAYIEIRRAGAVIQTINAADQTVATTTDGKINYHNIFDIGGAFDMQIGDTVYFVQSVRNPVFFAGIGGGDVSYAAYSNLIQIAQETIAPASRCEGYNYIDALNFVVFILTGQKQAVKSTFFGPGGPGYKYLLTNGFLVRNFTTLNAPVNISYKDILEGLSAIFSLSVQYLPGAIRIEPVTFVFNRSIILEITNIYNYKESHGKDYTFNEAETGYQKFAENDLNTLDEYNTFSAWLLPINSYKQKYTKRSRFIASGFSIEQARREQFKTNPSTSLSTDDDIFIIAYTEDPDSDPAGQFKAETTEPFDTVTGVISPETSYNLRISPRHILFNHAPVLNIGLYTKADTDIIQNTQTKNNGELITRFKAAEENAGAAGYELQKESDDIQLMKFDGREALFTPIIAEFKTRMTFDDLNKIIASITGQTGNDEANYGCIVFTDLDGIKWAGVVWSFDYNPTLEEASFVIRKKFIK